MYKDKKEQRKYKYEEELLETHTFRPEISENSKLIINKLSRKHLDEIGAAKYMPIYNEGRLKLIENQKQMKLSKIKEIQLEKEAKLKAEEDEILSIVAKKTNADKYNHDEIMENIESR